MVIDAYVCCFRDSIYSRMKEIGITLLHLRSYEL